MNMLLVLLFLIVSPWQAKAVSEEWQPLTASDGSFACEMPGNPASEKKKTDTERGPITIYEMTLNYPAAAYRATYVDYAGFQVTGAALTEQLKKIRDSLIAGEGIVLIKEEDITVAGLPGKLLRLRLHDEVIIFQKYFIAGGRLYQAIATGKINDIDNIARMDRFINSFQLAVNRAPETRQ